MSQIFARILNHFATEVRRGRVREVVYLCCFEFVSVLKYFSLSSRMGRIY